MHSQIITRAFIYIAATTGGLDISSPTEESKQQFEGSVHITKPHVEAIVSQEQLYCGEHIKQIQTRRSTEKFTALKEKIAEVDLDLLPKVHDFVTQARDKGASSWLTALPLREQGFDLNKEQFRGALSLRYNIPSEGLPSKVCTISFERPVNYLCDAWHVFPPKYEAWTHFNN